jgi:hypothetical protein
MSRNSSPSSLPRETGDYADVALRTLFATTTAALQLTQADHANRIVVLNALVAQTCSITLPKATGTGDRYTIINNVVLTQVVDIKGIASTDLMSGFAAMIHSTAVATSAESFLTTATDYICRWRGTDGTTGGKRGDMFTAIDVGPLLWLVRVECNTAGAVATPFASS